MQRLQQQLQHLAPRPAAGSESGTFVDFEALLTDSGVRLTAIPGIFAVVVEFIRYMLHARGVSYTLGSTDRDDTTRLYEETKQESIPTLFVDDERPLSSWLETTYRVASLGSGPELIPTSSADRATMFGLMNEIQGEGGLLFNKRFALVPPEGNEFGLKYGWSPEAVATADARIVDILGVLNAQLESQKAAGSQFFIGNSLTVLDLHWAAFSNMVAPSDYPTTQPGDRILGAFGATNSDAINGAVTPLLISHRGHIYEAYLDSGSPFPCV